MRKCQATGLRDAIRALALCLVLPPMLPLNNPLAAVQEPLGRRFLLEVGASGGPDSLLHQVVHAFRSRDGHLVVVDGGSFEVRVFNGRGELIRQIGGRGGAPGEFEAMSYAREIGADELFVYDGRLQRMSLIDWRTGQTRSVPLQMEAGVRWPAPVGLLRDSLFVFINGQRFEHGEMGSGVVRPPLEFLVFNRDGERIGTPVTIDGSEFWVPRDGGYAELLPFGEKVIADARNDRIVVATSRAGGLRLFDPGGVVRGRLAYEAMSRRISNADIEAYIGEAVRSSGGRLSSTRTRERVEEMTLPDAHPVLDRLLIGTDGRIYVRAYSFPRGVAGDEWTSVPVDGERLRLLVDPAFTPTQIGETFLVGVWRGNYGVETVRVVPRFVDR